MTHHPRHSRVGRLARWQRYSSYLILGLCAFSGLFFFLKREMGWELADIAARSFLVWHGVTAALALLVFGSVLPNHVRPAWNTRRNRASGALMMLVMSALMASGLLLYYGAEEWHDGTLWVHWIVGFASFAAFPLHLLLGVRANATRAQEVLHTARMT